MGSTASADIEGSDRRHGTVASRKLQAEDCIRCIRRITDDEIAFTSDELKEEFTLSSVARHLGTSRDNVRHTLGTVSQAADAVRLDKMQEFFAGMDVANWPLMTPAERFVDLSGQITEYVPAHFFVDSRRVREAFEGRVRDLLVEIIHEGNARGQFKVRDAVGAAQFAFDAFRMLAIRARADDCEIGSLEVSDAVEVDRSAYENAIDHVLGSWNYAPVGHT